MLEWYGRRIVYKTLSKRLVTWLEKMSTLTWSNGFFIVCFVLTQWHKWRWPMKAPFSEKNSIYFTSVQLLTKGVLKVLSITATTCRSLLLTSWATYKVAAIRGDQISLKVINILQLQQLHQYWKLYQKIAFPLTICMGSMGIYVCGPSWCPNYLPHRPKHLLKGFPCILTWCFPYLHSNLSWRFPLL